MPPTPSKTTQAPLRISLLTVCVGEVLAPPRSRRGTAPTRASAAAHAPAVRAAPTPRAPGPRTPHAPAPPPPSGSAP
eukprot:1144547-Prorocentrum_lima.AAC.1